ncbi:MAG: NFACT RNA binding domain-containing protein [Bacteroidota bacterium]
MHFHYYTLIHLAEEVRKKYVGQRIHSCLSQNKNELVIVWEEGYWRIGCHTPLTYIIPNEEYSRAKKNVVNLFQEIWEEKLASVEVLDYERVLILGFESGKRLILKMHGIGANVLLEEEGKITRLFNQQREEDWAYLPQPGNYDASNIEVHPELDHASILKALRDISPIFDKQFASRIQHKMGSGLTFSSSFEEVMAEVREPVFYLDKQKDRLRFLLFPSENSIRLEKGIVHALQRFQRAYYQFQTYQRAYKSLNQKLQKPLKKFRKVYDSYEKNIYSLEHDRNPEELGHILMANLHLIQTGQKKISLPDFYAEGEVDIKLDPKLSPQDNAQAYYRKHKQRKSKLRHLKTQLEEVGDKLLKAETDWEELQAFPAPSELALSEHGFNGEELKRMRSFFKEQQKEEHQRAKNRYPYRTFQKEGYEIFVGKNARNNDELSFKFASKEDLWLHAKDVAGSHVVIRQKAGKPWPTSVLEYAAQLAAFYSKRKNDSLVPVQYTPRKYIRKRKGDPPGKVAVDRESVIMVEPIRS